MSSISLRLKFLFGTIGIVIALGLMVIIFVRTTLSQKLLVELQEKGVFITEDIAWDSIDLLLTENLLDLQFLINDHKNKVEEIEYVFIVGAQSEVVAHTFEGGFPLDLKDVNIVDSEQTYGVQHLDTEKGVILDIAVPLLKGEIGVVHVGISEEPFKKVVANITTMIIGIIIVVLVIGSGATVVFAAVTIKPIFELIEVVKAVASGDLGQKVRVSRKDEIGLLGTVFNKMINNVKQAEEALKEVRDTYQGIFRNAQVGLLRTRVSDGKALDANDRMVEIFGFESKEQFIEEYYAPEYYLDQHTRERFLDKLKKVGMVDDFEAQGLHRDGSTFWARFSAILNSEKDYIDSVILDISTEKAALDALRENEERFRNVAESASDAIISANSQGNIVFWNKAAQIIFGYEESEVLGKLLTMLMPERYRNAHLEGLDRVGLTGKSHLGEKTVELDGLKKDGTEFPLELSLATWKVEKETFYSAIIRDITERRRAEEQIRASLQEKDVLLKEIHHRVKNNLQIISSLLNIQSDFLSDKHDSEIFRESQDRVKSMALVHEQLYQAEDLAHLNFGNYIHDLTGYLFHSYKVDPNRIILKLNIDAVQLDIGMAVSCGLIINELVANVLKHAFPGGRKGSIRISLKAAKGKLTLTVEDNGCGFPQKMDFRATETLGLQLVNILVEQLEGKFELKRNKGTVFRIMFNA